MQATLKQAASSQLSAVSPCHASHIPSYRRESPCTLAHSCCKVAPAHAQLLLSRWTLIAPATDSAVVPRAVAAVAPEQRGDFHVYAEDIGARPPIEKLKTDLRI